MDTERTDLLQRLVLLTQAQCSLHTHLLGHRMHVRVCMHAPCVRAHMCADLRARIGKGDVVSIQLFVLKIINLCNNDKDNAMSSCIHPDSPLINICTGVLIFSV